MALALSGTSNGSLNNLSLSGNTATIVDTGRAGGIVQVVQNTYQTTVSVTTATYTDTGLSASITPISSSNKVLVLVSQHSFWTKSTEGQGMGLQIVRDSTIVWKPVADITGPFLDYIPGSTGHYLFLNLQYLDSPATTSSTTYKTQGRPYSTSGSGAVTFNPAPSGGSEPLTPSVITLMEVVA